jgi:hypothetical protein
MFQTVCMWSIHANVLADKVACIHWIGTKSDSAMVPLSAGMN